MSWTRGWTFALLIAMAVVGFSAPAATVTDAPFSDVPGDHLFVKSVAWLADQGITRGCNPPVNDRYCPDDFVTRAQMASFLVRALFLVEGGGSDQFVDDDFSVHERDIDRLATAGITRGCNPPRNDRFCPDDFVTRGQMAAFLVRAFGLTDDGGGDLFVDDDHSIFERDIDRLATAGITRGCNPPRNDRFCPDDFVTRGQMAAFLHRAFGSPDVGEPGLNRIDPDHTLLPSADQVDFITYAPDGVSELRYQGNVDVGNIIVMGATPATPVGFIGKVTKVEGGIVTTVPGSLMEAIPQADLSFFSEPLRPVDSAQFELAAIPTIGGTFACGVSTVTIDGQLIRVDLQPLVLEAMKWNRGKLLTFVIGWEFLTSGEFQASAGPGASCNLERRLEGPVLGTYAGTIGPVPIVLQARVALDWRLGVSLQAGVNVGAQYQLGYEGHARYENGSWTRFDRPVRDFTPIGPTVTGEGTVTFELLPSIRTDVYGIAGPHARVGPYLEFGAVFFDDPWWTLDGGVQAQLGVSLRRWLINLNFDFIDIRLLHTRLAQAKTAPPAPPPPPPPRDPTITISPDSGPPGTVFTVSGSGFTPESSATVHLQRPTNGMSFPVESVSTDADGVFVHDISSDLLDPATYEVWAIDDATGLQSGVAIFAVAVDESDDPALVYAVSGLEPGVPGSQLYLIDPSADGADTLIGPVQTSTGSNLTMRDIAQAHDGTMYGVRTRLSSEILQMITELYVIDPETASATLLGESIFMDVNGLEVAPDGRLLGATSRSPTFQNLEGLVVFDRETGQATVVGGFGDDIGSSGDLAFSPDGNLYMSAHQDGVSNDVLVTLDPETGLATRVNPEEDLGYNSVWGIFFVADDLFGVTNEASECDAGALIAIDLDTATGSFIRCLVFGARGATTEPQN